MVYGGQTPTCSEAEWNNLPCACQAWLIFWKPVHGLHCLTMWCGHVGCQPFFSSVSCCPPSAPVLPRIWSHGGWFFKLYLLTGYIILTYFLAQLPWHSVAVACAWIWTGAILTLRVCSAQILHRSSTVDIIQHLQLLFNYFHYVLFSIPDWRILGCHNQSRKSMKSCPLWNWVQDSTSAGERQQETEEG